jgi:hypothetical protein
MHVVLDRDDHGDLRVVDSPRSGFDRVRSEIELGGHLDAALKRSTLVQALLVDPGILQLGFEHVDWEGVGVGFGEGVGFNLGLELGIGGWGSLGLEVPTLWLSLLRLQLLLLPLLLRLFLLRILLRALLLGLNLGSRNSLRLGLGLVLHPLPRGKLVGVHI